MPSSMTVANMLCGFYAVMATLKGGYGESQLIEICMVIGQYHLVAFTLNSLGVEREPGVAGFP